MRVSRISGLVVMWLLAFPVVGEPLPKADGFRGIWYQNGVLKNEYRFKYSGGLGTYCAKHKPFAVYRAEVDRTFFCYGGVPEGYHEAFDLTRSGRDRVEQSGALQHMISYFDHKTGRVTRPTILLDKKTHDAHDNPVMAVDDKGYIWIFSTAHGNMRPAFVHRSRKPYDIDAFERITPKRMQRGQAVPVTNFSYMQAWHVAGQGFVYFFTKYDGGRRETCFATSPDGVDWAKWTQLADIEGGHYQVSAVRNGKAACAFNHHPKAFNGDKSKKGLNWRTNLYYMETDDGGDTWRAADGSLLELPVRTSQSKALVHNFESEGLLVYLKDVVLDSDGHPLILFVTSKGYVSGPVSGPRTWRVARWSGEAWGIHKITTSDSNYDMGSIYLEQGGVMRVIAPTGVGPQAGNPGGEVQAWISRDDGVTWEMQTPLTDASEYNHTYVRRPVDAHPGFYSFWADGDGRKPSESRLYFANRAGEVFRLPENMTESHAKPMRVLHPAE